MKINIAENVMRKVLSTTAIFGFLLLARNTATAAPITLTFDNTSNHPQVYTESGFSFDAGAGQHWHIHNTLHKGHSNGISILDEVGDDGFFNLISLDHSFGLTQIIASNGTTVGDGINALPSGTITLPAGFSNVDFVQLRGHFTIDNVVVDQQAVVPEPASIAVWTLLLLTGVAVVWMRRRRAVPVLN